MNFNKYTETIKVQIYIGHGLQITYVGQGLFIFVLFISFFGRPSSSSSFHNSLKKCKYLKIKYLSKYVKLPTLHSVKHNNDNTNVRLRNFNFYI